MSQKKRIIFGLGSNLGDREKHISAAVKLLESELELSAIKQSEIFENPAMLLPNSPQEWDRNFFNIALSAAIDLAKFSPEKILEIVKKIEKKLGRKETQKWAPREIDIDILVIEGVETHLEGKLTIPHPGLFKRDFFYKTVAQIEPNFLR